MKRKLLAVFLTLCMVLSMLPMSAFAAWYPTRTSTSGQEVNISDTDSITYYDSTTGTTYHIYDVDEVKYYSTSPLPTGTIADGTEFSYTIGSPTGTAGKLYWYATAPGDSDHTHSMTRTAANAATCTEAGNPEYWYCSGCQKYFLDADGTTEADPATAAPSTPALGHVMTEHEEVPATCTANGTEAYWECSRCDKLFAGVNGSTEIKEPATIPAKGHDFSKGTTCANGCGAEETPVSIPVTGTTSEPEEEPDGDYGTLETVTASATVSNLFASKEEAQEATSIDIEVESESGANALDVTLTADAIQDLVDAESADSVTIGNSNVGKVRLGRGTVETFKNATTVELKLAPAKKSGVALPAGKKFPATAVAVSINLSVDGRSLTSKSDLGNTSLYITLDVARTDVAIEDLIVFYYSTATGAEQFPTDHDPVARTLGFTTTHLSDFYEMTEEEGEEAGLVTASEEPGDYSILTVTADDGITIAIDTENEAVAKERDADSYYIYSSPVTGTITLAGGTELDEFTLDGVDVDVEWNEDETEGTFSLEIEDDAELVATAKTGDENGDDRTPIDPEDQDPEAFDETAPVNGRVTYSFTADPEDDVLYQILAEDGSVKNQMLTKGGDHYTFNVKTTEHVMAYVGKVKLDTVTGFYLYDYLYAYYDTAENNK